MKNITLYNNYPDTAYFEQKRKELYNMYAEIQYYDDESDVPNQFVKEEIDYENEVQYNSTDEIESALYSDDKIVKVIVSGMSNYVDACNFYAKLYNNCMSNQSWVLANNGFPSAITDSSSSSSEQSSQLHMDIFTSSSSSQQQQLSS